MTHTLAMEWAAHGIRVNSVSPGLVDTAMTYWVPRQPDWDQQLRYYGGMPRLAQVRELGGAYVYLLSDAASYTTSIDIPVNGVIGSEFPLSLLHPLPFCSLSFVRYSSAPPIPPFLLPLSLSYDGPYVCSRRELIVLV